MGAGTMPQGGGGGGGVLGFDFFGNQGANPRPNLRDFSNPASATTSGWEGLRTDFHNWPRQNKIDFLTGTGFDYGGASAGKPTIRHTPSSQTAQQKADWDKANENWGRIEAARKKRQEAYLAMAQKTGPTPKGVDVGQYKKAGDPLTMGASAPAYEKALYGQPRKWRDQYASIVNLRT